MLFLGSLAIIQCWFLPGFTVLSFSKLFKIQDKILLSPLMSLFINYVLGITLIIFQQFNFQNIILIIIFEIFLILIIYRKSFNLNVINFFKFDNKIDLKLSFWFLEVIIYIFLILFIFLALNTIGEVIHLGDPVMMWNEWSKDIYNNSIPLSGDYPIAYPILGAITYTLLNTYEIEFFARIVCILYPLWIFLIYFRVKNLVPKNFYILFFTFLFSLFLIFYIFRHYSLYIGYVDPILFFITISLGYLYILVREKKLNLYNLLLITFAISTPSITKQTGILLTGLIPFILIIISLKENKKVDIQFFVRLIILTFIFSASWYLYKIYGYVFIENDTSNIKSLMSQVKGSYDYKISRGLEYAFGIFYPVVVFLYLMSLKNFYGRIVGLLLVLPYFLIWSLFFGNDNRNLSIALPLIAFVMSIGFLEVIKLISIKINNKILIYFSLTLFVFSTFIVFNFINEKRNRLYMINKNIDKQILRGNNIATNFLIYENLKNFKDKIIYTDDYNFTFLPKTSNRIQLIDCINLRDQLTNSIRCFW